MTGAMLREARLRAGLSLSALAGRTSYSVSHLCNVERGRRPVTDALLLAYDRELGEVVDRRGVIKGFIALSLTQTPLADDIYASIAGSDANPLAEVQTTHATDLVIASLVERPVVPKLRRWMMDGSSAVLRVNAAGILAKVQGLDVGRDVAAVLSHDDEVRHLYATAVLSRVCELDWQAAQAIAHNPLELSDPTTAARRLSLETLNSADAGARWCASHLLRELSPMLGA